MKCIKCGFPIQPQDALPSLNYEDVFYHKKCAERIILDSINWHIENVSPESILQGRWKKSSATGETFYEPLEFKYKPKNGRIE